MFLTKITNHWTGTLIVCFSPNNPCSFPTYYGPRFISRQGQDTLRPAVGPIQPTIHWESGFWPWGKAEGRDFAYCSYTSTRSICLHGVDRDNFSCYLYLSCISDTTDMQDSSATVLTSVSACTQHPLPNYIPPRIASAEITSLELT
jgi:hypothetical protein